MRRLGVARAALLAAVVGRVVEAGWRSVPPPRLADQLEDHDRYSMVDGGRLGGPHWTPWPRVATRKSASARWAPAVVLNRHKRPPTVAQWEGPAMGRPCQLADAS